MKKILIPTILTIAATPLISLVGCGKKPKPEETTFQILTGAMIKDNREATIQLDWAPSGNSITFGEAFSFVYSDGTKEATAHAHIAAQQRPLLIDLSFSEDIESNITDGVLSFHYKDNTTGIEDDATITNIKIHVIQRISFNECSWSEIGDACAKLESGEWTDKQFFSRFYVDKDLKTSEIEQLNVVTFDDFIGQKRYVYLNGSENKHEVIVLDCKADTINDSLNTKATFTFQFNNLISGHAETDFDAGSSLLIPWSDNIDDGNRYYWESTLENALNGSEPVVWYREYEEPITSDDEKISVYKMIENESSNDGLSSCIKDVMRGVNTYQESISHHPKYQVTPKATKLFCPTLSNYFSIKGIQSSIGSYITNDEANLYCAEGQPHSENAQYKYYSQIGIGDTCIVDASDKWSTFEQLQITNCKGEYDSYIFASPYLNERGRRSDEDPNITIWYYKNFNVGDLPQYAIGGDMGITIPYSIAPCFCI